MSKNNLNCLLAGVGGQGTILASKLIAAVFMKKGVMARTAETIGMAQRGGCVVSHVRAGEGIYSPHIPLEMADIIIGFEPSEAVRCLPFLKPEGTVVVSSQFIKPVTDALSDSCYDGNEMLRCLNENVSQVIIVDTEAVCRECGSVKVSNTALIGAAAESGCFSSGNGLMPDITLSDMEDILKEKVSEKFHAINIKAMRLGASYAR